MRLCDAPRDHGGRPIADSVYGALIAAIAEGAPRELGYLDSSRILVIGAAARRESSASVRPLRYRAPGAFVKPRIAIDGVEMLYEIALRPRFFWARSPEERLEVFVHELWHVSPRFDGTLGEDRRHEASRSIEREVEAIVSRLRASRARAATIAGELFAYEGELRLRAWLARPPSRERRDTRARLDYNERDLYSSVIEQRTCSA